MGGSDWSRTLGIERPRLEAVEDHGRANTFALLIVALLERGEAMTLAEVAARFEAAGVAPADRALLALTRCRPARPPVYRDGDRYHLDPRDADADLWVLRLGLRPPPSPALRGVGPEPPPLPRSPRRALLHGFPPKRPEAVALLDVGARRIETFIGPELAELPARLAPYDLVGAVDVRALLAGLGVDPGDKRLAELGPPQKRKTLDRRGRKLAITTEMLVRGSCGVGRPFGDQRTMARYLATGQHRRLRRRLEADATSLHALYQYGRLHGGVRLRWGFLDELVPAPWALRDEPGLRALERTALEASVPLEVVVGSAPGWSDPWSRARLAWVEGDPRSLRTWLVDERGVPMDEADVQCARLAPARR